TRIRRRRKHRLAARVQPRFLPATADAVLRSREPRPLRAGRAACAACAATVRRSPHRPQGRPRLGAAAALPPRRVLALLRRRAHAAGNRRRADPGSVPLGRRSAGVYSTGLIVPQAPGIVAAVVRTPEIFRYDRYLPASV